MFNRYIGFSQIYQTIANRKKFIEKETRDDSKID